LKGNTHDISTKKKLRKLISRRKYLSNTWRYVKTIHLHVVIKTCDNYNMEI